MRKNGFVVTLKGIKRQDRIGGDVHALSCYSITRTALAITVTRATSAIRSAPGVTNDMIRTGGVILCPT